MTSISGMQISCFPPHFWEQNFREHFGWQWEGRGKKVALWGQKSNVASVSVHIHIYQHMCECADTEYSLNPFPQRKRAIRKMWFGTAPISCVLELLQNMDYMSKITASMNRLLSWRLAVNQHTWAILAPQISIHPIFWCFLGVCVLI